jgi:hypothetical protein
MADGPRGRSFCGATAHDRLTIIITHMYICICIVIPSGVCRPNKNDRGCGNRDPCCLVLLLCFWIVDVVGLTTATLFEHRVVTSYSLCDLNIGLLLSCFNVYFEGSLGKHMYSLDILNSVCALWYTPTNRKTYQARTTYTFSGTTRKRITVPSSGLCLPQFTRIEKQMLQRRGHSFSYLHHHLGLHDLSRASIRNR